MRTTTAIIVYSSLALFLTISLVDLFLVGNRRGHEFGFYFNPRKDIRHSEYKCVKNGQRCIHDIECCTFFCAFNEKIKIGKCRKPAKGDTNSTKEEDSDSGEK